MMNKKTDANYVVTNGYEFDEEYRKAKKIADVLFALGLNKLAVEWLKYYK